MMADAALAAAKAEIARLKEALVNILTCETHPIRLDARAKALAALKPDTGE